MMRRTALLLLAAALPPGLVIGWLLLDGPSSPEALLEAPLPDLASAAVLPYSGAGCSRRRLCRDVTLDPASPRPVRIALSRPRAPGRFPAVILAGGLRTGREALRYVPQPGRNAIIAYEYPLDRQTWQDASVPARIVAARRAALAVPGQIAALLRWTRAQPWADPARVSLVGVSLGALVLPAAAHAAAAHGEPPAPIILAYGGTGLGAILRAATAEDGPFIGAPIAWLGDLGLRALEPARHLPHLAGPFLLINGAGDLRIPEASAAGLRRLTPEPKDVRLLPAGHIDTDDEALLAEILRIARAWLIGRGALNPRPGSRGAARGSPRARASSCRNRPRPPARPRAA